MDTWRVSATILSCSRGEKYKLLRRRQAPPWQLTSTFDLWQNRVSILRLDKTQDFSTIVISNNCYLQVTWRRYVLKNNGTFPEKRHLSGELIKMSYMHPSLLNNSMRMSTFMQNALRILRRLSHGLSPALISELLLQVKEACAAAQLRKSVNQLQDALWSLPTKEQAVYRSNLVTVLSAHVLHSYDAPLRLEAASWLRTFVQAGSVTQPGEVFVTLVTATTQVPTKDTRANINERAAYLRMIFDCFWPFRYPYPAFTWQEFPANEVFYPLTPLINSTDISIQEAILAIFAELPTLDDPEITEYLLPVALAWSRNSNPEHRRMVTNILARMSDTLAQEALRTLQRDDNQEVRNSARRAAEYVQRA